MTTLSLPAASRAILAASVLWATACLAFVAWNFARKPMAERARALDERLSTITYVAEELPEPEKAPMKYLRARIVDKVALWKALVAQQAGPEAKPDLVEMLKGVAVSRQQIVRGGAISVKARMRPDDKQGRWLVLGATVNGLTVKEIKPDVVVFSIQHKGKEYTAELPRK